jgi:hypothetical protein
MLVLLELAALLLLLLLLLVLSALCCYHLFLRRGHALLLVTCICPPAALALHGAPLCSSFGGLLILQLHSWPSCLNTLLLLHSCCCSRGGLCHCSCGR